MPQDVTVKLDNRIRLISAVLAATDWHDKAQERHPHGSHAHARNTRKYLHDYRTHDAVRSAQGLLDSGAPLEAMFAFGMMLSLPDFSIPSLPRWVPPRWNEQLHDFYLKSSLAQWWQDEEVVWQNSLTESRKMLEKVELKPFLKAFVGEVHDELIFMPNISYPTNQDISIRLGRELIAITPPRLAWGESPPWPFDEEAGYIFRETITQFGRLLISPMLRAHADRVQEAAQTPLPLSDQLKAQYPTWEEQFINVFLAAAVAIYLEDHVSKTDADAYIVMERKARGITMLPATISVLRRYLTEKEKQGYATLIDFLPLFPKQLRVAKRIVSL